MFPSFNFDKSAKIHVRLCDLPNIGGSQRNFLSQERSQFGIIEVFCGPLMCWYYFWPVKQKVKIEPLKLCIISVTKRNHRQIQARVLIGFGKSMHKHAQSDWFLEHLFVRICTVGYLLVYSFQSRFSWLYRNPCFFRGLFEGKIWFSRPSWNNLLYYIVQQYRQKW